MIKGWVHSLVVELDFTSSYSGEFATKVWLIAEHKDHEASMFSIGSFDTNMGESLLAYQDKVNSVVATATTTVYAMPHDDEDEIPLSFWRNSIGSYINIEDLYIFLFQEGWLK